MYCCKCHTTLARDLKVPSDDSLLPSRSTSFNTSASFSQKLDFKQKLNTFDEAIKGNNHQAAAEPDEYSNGFLVSFIGPWFKLI